MKFKILLLFFIACVSISEAQYIAGIKRNSTIINTNDLRISTNGSCDTVFSFQTISFLPSGLTYDDTYLYSSGGIDSSFSNTDSLIYKYDFTGHLIATIPSPAQNLFAGGDLDFDGTYLWEVIEQDAKIYKLDPVNGNVLLSFNLPTSSPSDPNDFGCAYDNGYIWITEYKDGTLMRINATAGPGDA